MGFVFYFKCFLFPHPHTFFIISDQEPVGVDDLVGNEEKVRRSLIIHTLTKLIRPAVFVRPAVVRESWEKIIFICRPRESSSFFQVKSARFVCSASWLRLRACDSPFVSGARESDSESALEAICASPPTAAPRFNSHSLLLLFSLADKLHWFCCTVTFSHALGPCPADRTNLDSPLGRQTHTHDVLHINSYGECL